MRTTVSVDDDLFERAADLVGTTERAAVFRLGLEALIQRESARRLALLGGSAPEVAAPPRRHMS